MGEIEIRAEEEKTVNIYVKIDIGQSDFDEALGSSSTDSKRLVHHMGTSCWDGVSAPL